tara:strand:+ start:481 stop:783 length:303 start_codon:yes stop_codon:yes gene_type:complete
MVDNNITLDFDNLVKEWDYDECSNETDIYNNIDNSIHNKYIQQYADKFNLPYIVVKGHYVGCQLWHEDADQSDYMQFLIECDQRSTKWAAAINMNNKRGD